MPDYLEMVIEQARKWDLARPRSEQAQLGWSEMASCRSYLGFRVRGEWASDDEENWRAIAGTGLHEWLTSVRRVALEEVQASFDLPVEYGGVKGHVDEVDWDHAEVTDYKFPSKASARFYADPEVLDEKFIQLHGYAAGIIETYDRFRGADVLLRLLVCPVDGTFDDWRVYETWFDRATADAALMRYAYVQTAVVTGEELPKDKPYRWCERYCEFFRACRNPEDRQRMEPITDPEMAAAVEAYGLAREAKTAAEAVMDAASPLIKGLYGTARGWKVRMSRAGAGKMVVDEDAMIRHYRDEGLGLPMRPVDGAPAKLLVSREKS